MKNLVKIMMVIAALVVLGMGQVWAYPITVKDQGYAEKISLTQSDTGAVNGDFNVWQNGIKIDDFTTFCVELSVTFNPGKFYTATIDEGIKTQKDGEVTESLHGGTKYLYWNFVQGKFAITKDTVEALQDAIWMLQNDLNVDDNNKFYSTAILDENVTAGNGYAVKVMNLWDGDTAKQSQLIAPVPEPGTLLLLGSGLAGLALYRRRTSK